jgi:lipoate-protein ligase A
MVLFDLGHLPGQQSMLIFHALARMGIEALILVSPESPLGSVGYFQDVEKEVDLDFCQHAQIPVMRREIGGGATYLDRDQVFYQVVWKRDNRRLPQRIKEVFSLLSEPPCEVYQAFGIDAQFRPENDIVTREGRKIAGEGGGNIGGCMVFVGGILVDFDVSTMSRMLKVPDEKFRDKVFKTMEENLTTMKRELGTLPPRREIISVLVERFSRILGPLVPAGLNRDILRQMEQLEQRFTSGRFLFRKTSKISRGVRIRQGVELLYGIHKARGGLIRTVEAVRKDCLHMVDISGDFQCHPKEGLSRIEETLRGEAFDRRTIERRIEGFYEDEQVETPGVNPEDFAEAIVTAKS